MRRIINSKRATDKPIEIFIALFVILAVAMVILKMFSSQIEQKKTEMEDQAQDQRARQAIADLDTYCDSQCSKAHRSLKDKVSYCTSYFRDEIDINKNSMPDFTMALDNIQGYCEDRIYCAAYRPCVSLDILTCKKLVCNYLESQMGKIDDISKADKLVGFNDESDTYNGLFQPGSCWSRLTAEEKKNHWFYNFMQTPDVMGGDKETCFFVYGTCLDNKNTLNDKYGATWEDDCIIDSDFS